MLDDILSRLGALSEADRKELEQAAMAATQGMRWLPSAGPQTLAYFHPADILLYGGQGGGGKTDLGLGLAFTAHRRSLILRRKYTNLDGIIDRAKQINGGAKGFNGKPPPRLTTDDGRIIVFGANQHEGDEEGFQGQPFDLKVFDEATQFLESQIWFHIGWLRAPEGQRTRALLATNPPMTADGDWIIGMFRPWLDLTYPKPAEHGEVRWFVRAPDGSDIEVDGPDPVQMPGADKPVKPMSRSFIPAALKDNPYLINTDYGAKLDGLPEPLRSAVRDGNFMAARQDADFQVIPTAWILAAQERWTPRPPAGDAMTAMAIDPAGGGADAAELCWRYGGWYGEIVTVKGEETDDGSSMAARVFRHRRDAAPVVVDVGGGYGGAIVQRMADNNCGHIGFNGASGSSEQTRDGSKLKFRNKRAEAWWRFREALDPDQEGGSVIALPPDPELRADLAAPTWELTPGGILLESKDKLRERLGRSPGKGDAVVMALSNGDRARRKEKMRHESRTVNVGFSQFKKR